MRNKSKKMKRKTMKGGVNLFDFKTWGLNTAGTSTGTAPSPSNNYWWSNLFNSSSKSSDTADNNKEPVPADNNKEPVPAAGPAAVAATGGRRRRHKKTAKK